MVHDHSGLVVPDLASHICCRLTPDGSVVDRLWVT